MEGTIKLELRSGVNAKYGKLPISIIYSVRGQRARISTGITIHKEYWNKETQTVKFVPQKVVKKLLPNVNPHHLLSEIEVRDINNTLNNLKSNINNIEIRFTVNRVTFTSGMVAKDLRDGQTDVTKKDDGKEFLFNFMDQYIADHQSTRELGSLSVYKSVKNHLLAFQNATKQKVRFNTIDYNFFQRFQTFLIHTTKTDKQGAVVPILNNTTIAKVLSTLKTFLNYARQQGIQVDDGYKSFVVKKEKLEVIALTQEEFDSILNLDLSDNKRLDQARDVFCFSCATGLRYSDVAQITRDQIKGDTIELVVKKTRSELTIPLNAISWGILEKYKQLHEPLPVISNVNNNLYIKEICKIAGINEQIEIVRFRGVRREVITYPKYELIHFHTGRKTFVTLSLEKGISAEEVMEMSGHSDYRSFKRYVKVTEKRKKVVMLKAWGGIPIMKVV